MASTCAQIGTAAAYRLLATKKHLCLGTVRLGGGSMATRASIRRYAAALVCSAMFGCLGTSTRADEGGVSFWLPGFFGSLAAAPQQPGWSLTSIYYHTSVSAGAGVARAREF